MCSSLTQQRTKLVKASTSHSRHKQQLTEKGCSEFDKWQYLLLNPGWKRIQVDHHIHPISHHSRCFSWLAWTIRCSTYFPTEITSRPTAFSEFKAPASKRFSVSSSCQLLVYVRNCHSTSIAPQTWRSSWKRCCGAWDRSHSCGRMEVLVATRKDHKMNTKLALNTNLKRIGSVIPFKPWITI